MNTIIIQPPLVQLNTPYPSGAYLLSFFKGLYSSQNIKGSVKWYDLSTELFHRIFSRDGLSLIFSKAEKKALRTADDFEVQGDDNSAFQLRRYVSQSELWCQWIDSIVQIVCGNFKFSGREFVHEFVRSAHTPRGARVENYLSKINRDVSADDAQIIASLSLADLADFITVCYDSNFSLIRYAERLATSLSSFDEILANLNSPVLEDFLSPLLRSCLGEAENTLFCISVPFPGCFVSALYCAGLIKKIYGKKAFVSFGGGYINTELRDLSEKRLFDFCDFVSYDKGYGSYFQLFDFLKENDYSVERSLDFLSRQTESFYKIRYMNKNKVVVPHLDNSEKYEKLERQTVFQTIPDFSEIDFSRSPRLTDDQNPMHRIWNDGAWIKIFLAYGCYWHRCSFCDTSLDYVKNYCSTDVAHLYDGIYEQAEKAKVFGLHFVDEACPPAALQKFALKNISTAKKAQKLTFWGNIRFEKTFSRDLADLLSKGGLTAVSGGIEIATGKGLDSINKGTDIENIVSACCAFKEAGILVHSYMIFGFWNQSEQDLIDSMETLRQLFAEGLIDSAFWHKFSLTKHSTVFREWKEGKHPELKPVIPKNRFAENDLGFEGEHKSEKYALPLNEALNLWMDGKNLNKNVESYFPFRMPKPSIPKNFVQNLIQKYEEKRDSAFRKTSCANERFVWIGGKPVILAGKNCSQLCWSYMGELLYADIDKNKGKEIQSLLKEISAENYETSDSSLFNGDRIIKTLGKKCFFNLRGKGLCKLI